MHRTAATMFAVGLAACASSGRLEVRSGAGDSVTGTAFDCVGDWDGSFPCDSGEHQAAFINAATGGLELSLAAGPPYVDGGGAGVNIELVVDDRGVRAATAVFYKTAFLGLHSGAAEAAAGGYIEPILVGRTSDDRSSGRFSIDFDLGVGGSATGYATIAGTYDYDPTLLQQ